MNNIDDQQNLKQKKEPLCIYRRAYTFKPYQPYENSDSRIY